MSEFKERDIVICSVDSSRKWMVVGVDGTVLTLAHWTGPNVTGSERIKSQASDCRHAFHCPACLDQKWVAGAACLRCGAARARGPRAG